MKNFSKAIQNSDLFAGIGETELEKMFSCLNGRIQSYAKGDFIFLAGRSAPAIGLLSSGSAQIVKENADGDSMMIGALEPGELFGETFACMGNKVMPVSVVALEPCEVLLLNVERIIRPCENTCPFHSKLIANLLRIMAEKNMLLNQKMSYLSHKTIRARLLAFLSDRARGADSFAVPFGRGEMADYLCIDRSAMSRELSHMKEEGILDYKGKNFRWLK